LVRQIESGAPVDVAVLAHERWVEHLGAAVLERRELLRNELVLIAPIDGPEPTIDALVGARCVAVGDPAFVPAGLYAREALGDEAWARLTVMPALDAPAAVALVAAGECPLGFAYRTDAVGVQVGQTLDADVRYVAVRLRERPIASSLFELLASSDAAAVFVEQGFQLP
jgi:molybdate transport system substrate-binding protein